MSFNGVLEGLFVYISPCIHPITCIRGEWSAIIGGTSPVTGFSDKKCLSIHIRDDPPFFITEPHASQSVSSHAISFSVNCNSFFGIETDLAAEGERKKHIFEVSGIEGCEPVEHLLEFVLVLQDHMVTFSPPTKTISVYKVYNIRIIIFLGKGFDKLFQFFLKNRIIRIRCPKITFQSFYGISFCSGTAYVVRSSGTQVILSVVVNTETEFQSTV